MFCSNCGNKLAEGAKFCSECGARVASADEQSFRTIADINFEEPKISPEVEEPREEPTREHISFDWSNVVDEPHKKEVVEIKSPWDDTGEIDEKELFAEMTQSKDKSRTMSFIDVLRAEKEEKERAAANKAIEYTEVLEIGHDLGAFEEPPQLHYAPLYEDVNEPVKTPFDEPEVKKAEPSFEEPRFETPEAEAEHATEMPKEPAEEPMFEEPVAETEEPKIELSRETIAQFDEYVKSFEKEAGIIKDEPRIERPLGGAAAMPKFELPNFLKRDGEKAAEKEPVAEPVAEPAPISDSEELFDEYEIRFDDEPINEPTFEVPVIEEADEQPVFEEPKYEDYTEDIYLDLDSFRDEPSEDVKAEPEVEAEPEAEYEAKPKHGAAEPEYEEDDEDEEAEEEADEPVNEADLFREMEESSPKHTGMTIAEPADTQSEIEALKRRLGELMGTPVDEEPAEAEPEEEVEAVPEPETETDEIFLEPENTADVDDLFAGLTAVSETPEEPVVEGSVVEETPAPEVEEEVVEETPVEAEPEPEEEPVDYALYLEPEVTSDVDDLFAGLTAASETLEEPAAEEVKHEEAAPVEKEEVEEAVAPVVEEAKHEEPAPFEKEEVEEAVAPVVEEAKHEEPAPVEKEEVEEAVAPVVEEVKHEEPAPVEKEVVEEAVAPAAEEAKVEEEKASDALSLEELEKDLFGEIPEGEVEETKKIDKFYTLYKKNEEFQRLLDEEYEKLKNGGASPEPAPVAEEAKATATAAAAAVAPAVTPAEDEKAYRQVEDETIYMSKEDVEKQISGEVKAEEKPEEKPDAGNVFAVKTGSPAPAELGDQASKKADKAAKKAEKAAKKAEKAAKKSGGYDDVDSGSGVLTVLAVIIAIILVILLAVIVIMTVAPGSGIGIWINDHIQNLTSGIGAIYPGDGQFLL